MSVVLVTGGAGYIGSHACKALRAAGFTPVTYDNLSTGWEQAVKFGPFERGDLLDRARLDDIFTTHNPIAVMHFAALSQVGESVQKPDLYWRNNVTGSENLIKAATQAGCQNFIFSSTCATYGEQDGVLLDENSAQRPINPYGETKLAIEKLLLDHGNTLRHVIFRYFNVAGADPEAAIGECHEPETHLIPIVMEALAGRRAGISVFGTDYDTPDGTCIRDYVHVMDLVQAHILGLRWLLDGKDNAIFNLGTGHGFSVQEVIDTCQKELGQEVPHTVGARREGDCAFLVSGGKKAGDILKWTPERSTLQQIIKDAWRWHKKGGRYT